MINELISIIIPIYKVENYLEKCIESVVNQSYKNIEIILINDASPDKSIEICNKFKNIDQRIIIINKIVNEGVSAARNSGLDLCKGKYVTFIDGDDYISINFIELLYTGIKKENAQIAQGEIKKIFVNSNQKINKNINEIKFYSISSYEAVKNMYAKNEDIFINYVLITGKLYDKKLFEKLNFPIGKSHEDEFLNYKLYFFATKIIYTKIDLYFYVQRIGSFCNTKYTIDKISKIEALEERSNFFKINNSIALYNYTIYALFCNILYNIYTIKKYFQTETNLIYTLEKKLHEVKNEINEDSSLDLRFKIIINIYYNLRIIFQFRNSL
jgi:glycosyltransferase involved in cell wall biosynthesis